MELGDARVLRDLRDLVNLGELRVESWDFRVEVEGEERGG